MAIFLIDGIIGLGELIGDAIEADAAANAVSASADGLSNVAWGTIPEGAQALGALGVGVGTIAKTMAQTTGKGSGSSTNLLRGPDNNSGTGNVVYDPGSSNVKQVVFRPFVDSRGDSTLQTGEYAAGSVGIFFGPRKRKRNKYL